MPHVTISYTIIATGIPKSEPAPITPPAPVAQPDDAPLLATTATGTILGNRAGAFAFYKIAYPGRDEPLHITLWFSPCDPMIAPAFGMNVYGPPNFVGHGAPNADSDPGILTFSYNAQEPDTLLLQIYNYSDDFRVSYGLSQ